MPEARHTTVTAGTRATAHRGTVSIAAGRGLFPMPEGLDGARVLMVDVDQAEHGLIWVATYDRDVLCFGPAGRLVAPAGTYDFTFWYLDLDKETR